MRRYLIVAHRTLCGKHLIDELRARQEAGECSFHLLVPVHHPRDHTWSDGEVKATARKQLEEGIARFAEEGIEVTGEIGEANPVLAISDVLRDQQFDEIIISTLPPKLSRWLKTDVVHRVEREFSLPVTHVMPEQEPAAGNR